MSRSSNIITKYRRKEFKNKAYLNPRNSSHAKSPWKDLEIYQERSKVARPNHYEIAVDIVTCHHYTVYQLLLLNVLDMILAH